PARSLISLRLHDSALLRIGCMDEHSLNTYRYDLQRTLPSPYQAPRALQLRKTTADAQCWCIADAQCWCIAEYRTFCPFRLPVLLGSPSLGGRHERCRAY